jgi:glycosyltransferase involved in cell wall biosynthesis
MLLPHADVPERLEVSVIIMAYNEGASVAGTVKEIADTLAELEAPCEIVIVDDGSTDGTCEVARSLADALHNVRLVRHPANRGLGGVYRTGFAEARGRYVTFFPADGQFPATIIKQFLPLMEEHDMVLGYLPKRNSPLVGKVLSWVERLIYRFLFGPMPRFQGILMFRRSILDETPLRSDGRGWAVLMELILRVSRAGRRMLSVPTEMRPRLHGESKVNNWRCVLGNVKQLGPLYKVLS